eukprot:m.209526 g.209526  ORF g.209526 m.209526 type:complete len:245 (-) comp18986_c0_seq4:181-915(-)
MRHFSRFLPVAFVVGCLLDVTSGSTDDFLSSKPRKTSTLVVFHTSWCEASCEASVHAVRKIQDYATSTENLNGEYTAMEIDCSSPWMASVCCRLGIDTYPSVLIFPNGTTDYWEFLGDREYFQMRHALFYDRAQKPLKPLPPDFWGHAKCSMDAIYNQIHVEVLHAESASVLLGVAVGVVVGLSCTMVLYLVMSVQRHGSFSLRSLKNLSRADGLLLGFCLIVFYMLYLLMRVAGTTTTISSYN